MAKKQKAIRGKFADEKYLGQEPDLRGSPSNSAIINAYNWYNYFYDAEKAKSWIVEYLHEFHKTEKELIKNVNRIPTNHISNTIGWNCRILLMGGTLPEKIRERIMDRLRAIADRDSIRSGTGASGDRDNASAGDSDQGEEGTQGKEASGKAEVAPPRGRVISVQERVINRSNELIADLEVLLDAYYNTGEMFKPSDWFSQNDVKPAIAVRIAEYYKPLYAEAYDALAGKDPQLREGYASYKKPKLKAYVEFLRSIVSAAETRAVVAKAARKPRKKKEKPVSVIVAKLNYKVKDEDYSLQSARAIDIPGCNQLWVFNTKYRTLAVYNAIGPAGLGVKGSTLTGFDEKTSQIKTLRKPKEQLKALQEGGKIVLRKFMDGIKCKPKAATGRINKETILVRIIK